MQYEDFVKLLHQRNVAIVQKSAKRIRGHDVDTYRALARMTEKIDYDCGFNGGNCLGRARGANGCCTSSRCAVMLGYWRREGDSLDEDTVRKIAGFYDENNGFLRDGEGCVLPRELRSPTCLYIYCSDRKMSDDDKILLARIQFGAFMS